MRWTNQYKQLPEQSAFHEAFRQLLITDHRFKHLRCYQEVNVQDLVEGYPHSNHHFDWYIYEWNTVIELHGEQHYKATSFGKQTYEDKQIGFHRMQYRDNLKATSAQEVGINYIAIPYKLKKKLSYELLEDLIRSDNANPWNGPRH